MTGRTGRPPFRWSLDKYGHLRTVLAVGGTLAQAAAQIGTSAKTVQRHAATNPLVADAIRQGKAARPGPRHGTTARYRTGCRCNQCRAANTAYYAQRRTAAAQ